MVRGLSSSRSRRSLLSDSVKLTSTAGLALMSAGVIGTKLSAAQSATPASGTPMAMPAVDPQMQTVLDVLASFNNPPIEEVTPDVARNLPGFDKALKLVEQQQGITVPEMAIRGIVVPGPEGDIACRTYAPAAMASSTALPAVVYFHGGGFVIANLDTYESSCIALADLAQCLVVSVAYRQAPEHPFTAAVDDAYAATQYVLASGTDIGADPDKVAVVGESAGGNLATVVCLKARDEGGLMPRHQVLIYPITTYAPEGEQTQSITQHADAKPLNAAMLGWFKGYYLPDAEDAQNAYASPLLAADLSGLPPATIIQAEIDPLQSQGTAYAEALTAAGVGVTATLYPGVTHEFFGMGSVIDTAKAAEQEAAQALLAAFSPSMATPTT